MPEPGAQTRRAGRAAWAVSAALFAAAVTTAVAYFLWPRHETLYTDGRLTWPAGPAVGVRTVLWDGGQPIQLLAELGEDYDPCLSSDGTELYFTRGKAGGGADLYVAYRAARGWGAPHPITEINTTSDEIGPALGPDGATLYFYSDRPGGEGGYDLYVTRHEGDHWTAPRNLGPRVNSPYNEYDPAVSPDGAMLLWASNRPTEEDRRPPEGAWPATLREQRALYDYDIYAVDLGAQAAAPRLLAEVNSPFNDGQPAVSPDGQWLYFASDRPGGRGKYDLYRSRIGIAPLAGFFPPEVLGEPVNTPANELDPALTVEGFGLYFSSDRAKDDSYAIYYARSHEVFPMVRTWRPRVGLIAARLSWPLVGLILALAGLVLAVLALTKLHRRPGLLASALIVSLILHLVALSLFNVWRLSARLAELAQFEQRFEVVVTIPSVAESRLSAELRTALAQTSRTDTAQFVREKSDALAAPPEPKLKGPDLVLAKAEPPPQKIEIAPPEVRPDELREAIRPQAAPPPMPDLALPEMVDLAPPKEVRPAEAPAEALPPQPLAMRPRPETPIEPREPPAPRPAARRPDIEPVRVALPEEVPEAVARPVEPAALAARPPRPAETPPIVDLAPAEEVPARPVREARAPTTSPVSTRPLASPRAETPAAEPSAAIEAPAPSAPSTAAVAEAVLPLVPSAQPEATAGGAVILAERPAARAAAVAVAETLDLAPPAVGPEIARKPHAHTNGRVEAEPAVRALAGIARPESPVGPAASAEVRGPAAEAPLLGAQAVARSLVEGPLEAVRMPPLPPRLESEIRPATGRSPLPPVQTDRALQALVAAEAPIPLAPRTLPVPVEATVGPRPPLERTLAARRPEAPALEAAPIRPVPAATGKSPLPPTAADRTLLASTAPVGPKVAAPLLGEAVRIALVPQTTPAAVDLAPPPEPLPLAKLLTLRTQPDRDRKIEELGGSKETEEAVRLSLVWFARHQSRDGRWDVDGFAANFAEGGRRCDGAGERRNQDVGVTALAALVFLGGGHTHLPPKDTGVTSPYAASIQRALEWLLAGQRPDGDLRQGGQMYDHALAAMVLAEAFTLTGDPRLPEPIRKAVDFIVKAQRPGSGWRYEPRSDSDTSVLGWQVMALKSAEVAGFEVPPAVYRGAANWLDRVRSGRQGGLYCYQPKREPSFAMTAEGLFSEQLMDFRPNTPRAAESVRYLQTSKPEWHGGANDLYYWYYATLALHQLGGPAWDQWNAAMRKALLDGQRKDGPFAGSWDPKTRWGNFGGRVYSTALAALCLEVYYRYLPLYDLDLGGRRPGGAAKTPAPPKRK